MQPIERARSAEQFANQSGTAGAYSTLAAALTASTTAFSIQSADAGDFPDHGPFRVLIESEIVQVWSIGGVVCQPLTRGAEGTTAASHSAGKPVRLILTDGALSQFRTLAQQAADPASALPPTRVRAAAALRSLTAFSL